MSKVDPIEFESWAKSWLKSRTQDWWEAFANEVNEGRPESDRFVVPEHLLRPSAIPPSLQTEAHFNSITLDVLPPIVSHINSSRKAECDEKSSFYSGFIPPVPQVSDCDSESDGSYVLAGETQGALAA